MKEQLTGLRRVWYRLNLFIVQGKLFDLSVLRRYRHWVVRKIFHTGGRGLSIGHNVEIWSIHNQNNTNLFLGANVKIDSNCFIDLAGKVVIERDVIISRGVMIYSHFHDYQAAKPGRSSGSGPWLPSGLKIHRGVWIGSGAIIQPKCTEIGEGSIVASGSVVITDVPPYTIVAGNPAKVVKTLSPKNVTENTVNQL